MGLKGGWAMKNEDIKVGRTYQAKYGGRVAVIKVVNYRHHHVGPAYKKVWIAEDVETGETVEFKAPNQILKRVFA